MSVDMKDGVLPGMNVAGKVIKGLSHLPFLTGGGLYDKVGAENKSALDSPDMSIKSLTGAFHIEGGKLHTSNLVVVSSFYTLDANGTVGFDQTRSYRLIRNDAKSLLRPYQIAEFRHLGNL